MSVCLSRELLFHMDEERLLTSNPDEEEAGGSTDGDASDLFPHPRSRLRFPEWRERVQSTVLSTITMLNNSLTHSLSSKKRGFI